jgi:hypothetical protein
MNPTVLGTIITSSGSILVAVVALVLNHRGFADLRSEMNARFAAVDVRFAGVEKRLDLIEHRLDVLEGDLKEFNKVLARQDTDIGRLKDKTGLS